MILGGSCTSVTDPIAKTSKHWRIPLVSTAPTVHWSVDSLYFICLVRMYFTQLSYADTHPMFTRKSYPNFFRIVPSENAFNAPRIKLLKAFNWTRVGTLYQNEPRFALVSRRHFAPPTAWKWQRPERGFTNASWIGLAERNCGFIHVGLLLARLIKWIPPHPPPEKPSPLILDLIK